MNKRTLETVMIVVMLLLVGVAVYIFTNRPEEEVKLLNSASEVLTAMFNDNAYVLLTQAETTDFLLVNAAGEAIKQTGDDTYFYPIGGGAYKLSGDKLTNEAVSNDLTAIQEVIKDKAKRITPYTSTEFELSIDRAAALKHTALAYLLVEDVTATTVIYRIRLLDNNTPAVTLMTENSLGERTTWWKFSGYQSMPDWSLDPGWYTADTDKTQLAIKELGNLSRLVLTVYAALSDASLEWNVTGDIYTAQTWENQSLEVDSALLYLQNHKLGFIGSKSDLMNALNLFYANANNKEYRLYTALLHTCAANDWLISGVDYTPEEIVIQPETTESGTK